jgi:NAD(P)H-flavin reductase
MPGAVIADSWHVHAMRISSIHSEIDGVATYDLEFINAPASDAYRSAPGQFNMLYLPGVGESAISLSGDCHNARSWRHTVRVAGRVTQTLAQLRAGDQIGVRGPFGACWPIDDWRGHDVVLVAGGIGLAPVRPAIYELLRRRSEFGRLTLVYGARDSQSLLYRPEFSAWEGQGLTVLATVDRPSPDWTGHLGVVTLLIDQMDLPQPQATVFAVCGPEVMICYSALSAGKRGISAERIWVSLERNMQCAVGLCGHCQLGPEFICKDGPVLRYDRVRHLLRVEAL